MRVKFQYRDWTTWEGSPADGHLSPDKGVIRMWAITADDRRIEFVYDDFYYFFREGNEWIVGSGTPRREYHFGPDDRAQPKQRPVVLPAGAIVRRGEAVPFEEAVKFGLVKPGEGGLGVPNNSVPIEFKGCCG